MKSWRGIGLIVCCFTIALVTLAFARPGYQANGSADHGRVVVAGDKWGDNQGTVGPTPVPVPGGPSVIVSATGNGQYTTISAALVAVQPGTTILVRPGQYNEAVAINKSVSIVGDGPRDQIVVVNTIPSSNTFEMNADQVLLRNLTIRLNIGTNEENCHNAIQNLRGYLTVQDCDVTGDSCAAIESGNEGTSGTFQRVRVHDSNMAGFLFRDGAAGTVDDCEITNSRYAGIEIRANANPTVTRCRVLNGRQCGILVGTQGRGMLIDNEVRANGGAGIEIREGGNPTIRGGVVSGNVYQGIWVYRGGTGTVQNCDLRGNGRGAWLIQDGCTVNASGNLE